MAWVILSVKSMNWIWVRTFEERFRLKLCIVSEEGSMSTHLCEGRDHPSCGISRNHTRQGVSSCPQNFVVVADNVNNRNIKSATTKIVNKNVPWAFRFPVKAVCIAAAVGSLIICFLSFLKPWLKFLLGKIERSLNPFNFTSIFGRSLESSTWKILLSPRNVFLIDL